MLSTDKAWEKWGKADPYYGVLSADVYRKENLNADNKKAFFESGEEYIEFILKNINEHVDNSFSPGKCLDFGCGVGRLVIPLAKRYKDVAGIDVSDSMLELARRNCQDNGISNADFYKSDDDLSAINGKFDLITSCLVFQHIPAKRGKHILEKLLQSLNDRGVAVLQIIFYRNAPLLNKFSCWLQKKIPLLAYVINIFRKRKFFQPPVQMNCYNLTEIIKLLADNGIGSFFALPGIDKEYYNVILFCRKNNSIHNQ